MAKLSPLYDAFVEVFGQRLKRYGFPPKKKSTGFIQLQTPSGYVGIHIAPIHRWPVGLDVTPGYAISNAVVQKILEKTELYHQPKGLTWTCGALIRSTIHALGELQLARTWRDEKGLHVNLDDVKRIERLYGIWLDADADAKAVNRMADHAFSLVERWAWPVLERYGFSDEAMLELTMRDDNLADLLFSGPRKPLTGLILARHLDKGDAAEIILATARKRHAGFAAHGNPRIEEQFEKLVRVLKLI